MQPPSMKIATSMYSLNTRKAGVEDILVRITDRGSEAAAIHLLPTVLFRNTWSWPAGAPRPICADARASNLVELTEPEYGTRWIACAGSPKLLFTGNEMNEQPLLGIPMHGVSSKMLFKAYIVHGARQAVNAARTGTKAAAHYQLEVPAIGENRGPVAVDQSCLRTADYIKNRRAHYASGL